MKDLVLIETYWNVNDFDEKNCVDLSVMVLIETYWNVNSLTALEIINLSDVLIETYWNVNLLAFSYLRFL